MASPMIFPLRATSPIPRNASSASRPPTAPSIRPAASPDWLAQAPASTAHLVPILACEHRSASLPACRSLVRGSPAPRQAIDGLPFTRLRCLTENQSLNAEARHVLQDGRQARLKLAEPKCAIAKMARTFLVGILKNLEANAGRKLWS